MAPSPDPKSTVRAMWMAIISITAAIVAIAGGVLAWLDGASLSGAVMKGACGFAGTVLLLLAVAHFLSGDQS